MNKGYIELDVNKVIKQPVQKPLGPATNKPKDKEKKDDAEEKT